jgi:hypothetical protein
MAWYLREFLAVEKETPIFMRERTPLILVRPLVQTIQICLLILFLTDKSDFSWTLSL